jgi:cobalt-zinc-cadmium efflux system protein
LGRINAMRLMPHPHSHSDHDRIQRNFTLAFWLNTGFAILEIAGGLYTNSVAILSDALHDFGDSLSLGLAFYFQRKSLKKRDDFFSYGYKRFSLLGAFINSLILIIGSIFILQEALHRLARPEQANAKGMLALAVVGIVANAIAMFRLRSGNSINERVVALHFLEDVLGWVAVLIGSVVMLFADVPILDPVLSVLIAGFILFNVYKNLRQAFRIILQGIPDNVDMEEIGRKIKSIPGITGIHDVHTWSMDGHYNIMTLHLVVKPATPLADLEGLKREVRLQLQHLNIQHLTIETEFQDQSCDLKES